jgi:PAS domain S-box-containing protein
MNKLKLNAYFQSLTVVQRVAGFAAISIIAVMYIGLTTFPELKMLAEINQRFYEHAHTTTNTVRDMKFTLLYMRRVTRDAIFETDPDKQAAQIASLETYHRTFFEQAAIIRKSFIENQQLVSDAEAQYRKLIAYTNESLAILKAGKQDEAWNRSIDRTPGNPGPLLAEKLDQIYQAASEFAAKMNHDAKDIYQSQVRQATSELAVAFFLLLCAAFVFTRSITRQLGALSGSIVALSEGKLEEVIPFQDQKNEMGEISRGVAVLQNVYRKMEAQGWVKTHVGEISVELHKARNFVDLAQSFLSYVAPLLSAGHAVFYILDEADNRLRLLASYGYRERKQLNQHFAIGQGLVGQCAFEKATITLTNPPEDYVRIVSGLGECRPRCIAVLPILHTGKILGVFEIASFQPFDDKSMALLEQIMPIFATNLEILGHGIQTQRLLEETQEQAKRMEMQAARLEEQSVEMDAQQNELKQTEAWFRGIVESAPDGMLVVDEQGMIVLSNPKSEEVFGYEAGGLIGRNIDHLLPLDIRARHPAMREKFMSERQSRPMSSGLDLKGMREDGVEFPIEVGLSRLPDVGGREKCVCASVRDITERKLAEDTIREAREIAEADDVDEMASGKEQE